jgi:RimJ/RimL family protein N-acetyltransferase
MSRRLRSALTLARQHPRTFLRELLGRVTALHIYAIDTDAPSPSSTEQAPGTLRWLSEDELASLDTEPAFRERQLARVARFGQSYAFGVFVDDQPAHVSWLIPAEAIAVERPSILRAAKGTFEITACETRPEFRGRGLYTFAIRQLLGVAAARGGRRVYMKAAPDNRASQAGIAKAGLTRAGTAILFAHPLFRQTVVLRLFR